MPFFVVERSGVSQSVLHKIKIAEYPGTVGGFRSTRVPGQGTCVTGDELSCYEYPGTGTRVRACVVWCFFFWGGFVVKEFPLGELFEQFSLVPGSLLSFKKYSSTDESTRVLVANEYRHLLSV